MEVAKINILYVYNGQSIKARKHLVVSQGKAIEKLGPSVGYFDISANGMIGYLRQIFKLRKIVKQGNYNLIHTQFGISGFLALFVGRKPIVVSIMGTDYKLNTLLKLAIRFLSKYAWDLTIVKSKKLYDKLKLKNSIIIPNGINLNLFEPIDREIARNQADFNATAHILWVSNPNRKEKNFNLACEALSYVKTEDVELSIVDNVEVNKVPSYYYAADVLLLTSKWEGSPNVVKEAMACSLPIVSTDVGDVAEITKGIDGCFIVNSEPREIAKAIDEVLKFGKRTNSRDRVKHLDLEIISKRLLKTYVEVLSNK